MLHTRSTSVPASERLGQKEECHVQRLNPCEEAAVSRIKSACLPPSRTSCTGCHRVRLETRRPFLNTVSCILMIYRRQENHTCKKNTACAAQPRPQQRLRREPGGRQQTVGTSGKSPKTIYTPLLSKFWSVIRHVLATHFFQEQ